MQKTYISDSKSDLRTLLKYRKFGRLDWNVSALGFGAMRLPVIGEDQGSIDETEAIRMIRYAVDHGVNYIDTAYSYHSGNSETVVGKALEDGYHEKAKVATKMPAWMVNSKKDMDRFLDEQLRRLQTDQIEFYLLHGLDKERWFKMQSLNVLEWADDAIADARIRYLGFSFHDKYDVFKDIVDGYDGWTLCQIQYNYMDADYQAGTKGLKYAASRGLAVVIMEPNAGGLLAVKPPPEVQAIWEEAEIKRTPIEWALQWVWNHPEVAVVLSGMSAMNQVVENVEYASRSDPSTLTEKDLKLISRVRKKYLEYGFAGCTGCRYCMPCPNGVDIPEVLAIYNEYYRKRGDTKAQQEVVNKYSKRIPPEKSAKQCAKCGECEGKCPQQLPIRNMIARAVRRFETD